MADTLQPVFTRLVEELMSQAKDAGEAARSRSVRRWSWPQSAQGSPSDPSALNPTFDRGSIVARYATLLESGTAADVAAIKLQGDYVGTDERATRARFSSQIRLRGMAAARRTGHGQAGGIFGQTVAAVQDTQALGGSS